MTNPQLVWKFLRTKGLRFLLRGIPRGLPPELRRCHQALRFAIPLHLASTSPYVFLFGAYGAWSLSGLSLLLCLCYLLAFWLSRWGAWDAAKILVLISVDVSIGGFSLLLGEQSRLENTLLYGMTAPFLFFSVREARRLFVTISVPMAIWMGLHLWGYDHVVPYPLNAFQILLFKVCIAPTTAVLLLIPMFFLLRAQAASEKKLGDTAARALASSRAKSEFLAMVSHELRTPLNGVIGSLELFEQTRDEGERQMLLSRARRSGELLQTVIGDILDFSRLEKGTVDLRPVAVRPDELLDHVCDLVAPAIAQKSLRLRRRFQTGNERYMVDPERFQQIAINLVGNAIKFTSTGEIRVELTSERHHDDVLLQLVVEDTGIGIPADRIGELFQPFVQAHRGLKGNAEGCGLGLSICRELANSMGGGIEVQSRVGIGSRFTVRLQVEKAPTEVSASDSSFFLRQDVLPDRLAGNALVVDDVKTNRLVATRMIGSLGMTGTEAEDGARAVELWERDRHPVVFMDLQMPVLDGLSATRRIRALEGQDDPYTIVLALTANVFPEERRNCLDAGMDGFLEKPITRKAILKELIPLVRRYRPELLGVGHGEGDC